MAEKRPSSIVRVAHERRRHLKADIRGGGGSRKMFYGAKERFSYVSAAVSVALSKFRDVYGDEWADEPYLELELSRKAIAKSHSPRGVLSKFGIDIVGSGKLENKVVHGRSDGIQLFRSELKRLANVAPNDDQLASWEEMDRERARILRENKKLKKNGEELLEVPDPASRVLHGTKMSYNDAAQISTIEEIKPYTPDFKFEFSEFNASDPQGVILTTFPVRDSLDPAPEQLEARIEKWIHAFDNLSREVELSKISLLRASKSIIHDFIERLKTSDTPNLWRFDEALPWRTIWSGTQMSFFVPSARQDQIEALAALPFVRSISSAEMSSTRTPDSDVYEISTNPVNLEELPVVGIVDLGIPKTSPLSKYVLEFRGDDRIRKKADFHASDVGYLLVSDTNATPWRSTADKECAIIDVAAALNPNTLLPNISEATLRQNDVGTVNLSRNLKVYMKRIFAPPQVSALGHNLDEQSFENEDLMIVNSAGNSGSIGMDPPADGVHVVSVGAISRKKDKSFEPCSYSCKGGGIAHNVKPTFVVPLEDLSGENPSHSTRIPNHPPATSFAAPIVSRSHAGIAHRNYTRDESLVLMVQHARIPGQDLTYQATTEDLERFGFGIAPSVAECDPPGGERFTMLYEVRIPKKQLCTVRFPVPKALDGHSALVRLSSYTRAPVRQSEGEEYVAVDAPTRFRMYHRKLKTPYVDLPPEPQDVRAQYERHRVEYGWKWSVLKRFSGIVEFNRYDEFELRIGPTVWRDWAEQLDFEQLLEEAGRDASVKVQCALSFFPLEDDAPGFFEPLTDALAEAGLEIELPAEIELENEMER